MNDLRESVKKITTQPGVYLMRDSSKKVIYVGKAKNLKNRVSQYFQKTSHEGKTKALVANIRSFETIVTASETQALILENDLIKQYKPRYNVLLKDSKSYPYIFISKDKHPRVGFYRGNKNTDLKFFGPYISPYVVRES
ncbi:MAG: GIY-YIG nuclease family protein, partial [Gammaproteobacteria bacterium]